MISRSRSIPVSGTNARSSCASYRRSGSMQSRRRRADSLNGRTAALRYDAAAVVLVGGARVTPMRQDSGMPRRTPIALATVLLVTLLVTLLVPLAGRGADTLPASLTDREFWSLTEQLSEPNGYFVSRSGSPDNLLSNEMQISSVAAALAKQAPRSGVYLGVGPEQNFT